MATTTNGIYYPTSSDPIAPLEGVFSTMATSVDTAITTINTSFNDAVKIIKSGVTSSFTVGTSVGNSTTVAVTFSSTPVAFSASPAITATLSMAATGSAYAVAIFGVSATGFTAKVTRVNGTTNDGDLFINWIARS
jgi:hypothetical protein